MADAGPPAQYLASTIPLTYYLRVVRRPIVLKSIGPLIDFGVIVFTLAVLRFRKQLE